MLDNLKNIIKRNKDINIIISFIYNKLNKNKIKKCGSNVIITKQQSFLKNVRFDINGNNIHIKIGRCTRLQKCKIFIKGNNHNLIIGDDCIISNSSLWFEENNCEINIGNKVTCEGAHFASIEPNSKIEIEDDCMFSHDIELRTGDSHSIIDVIKNKRINPGKNIKICSHVWVGAYSKILKGVTVEENSVIGLGSIVTKNIKKNTINVGIPSKIIRENITWDRELYSVNSQ